jgi:hypothetical protein
MIRAFLPLLSEPQHELALLHLCEPAVHKQFRSRDVAAVVGREKHHRLRDLVGRPKSHQSLSDCEDDPAEGAALNQVTQSISRFGQRKGLSHDRFDGAGLKQRDDNIPGVSPGRLRLSEQYEALDAGPLPDQICDVNGCLAARRITQCCEASAQRQRSERLAQDFTTDPVDHDVCAVTACDTSHAATQLLDGGINDLIESERLRLLGFRMIGRLEMACFAPKARANCVTALPTDPPIAGASTVLPA